MQLACVCVSYIMLSKYTTSYLGYYNINILLVNYLVRLIYYYILFHRPFENSVYLLETMSLVTFIAK